MADHVDGDDIMADEGGNNDVFIYTGGLVPQHLRETITHIRIHKSVKIIRARAFQSCINLVSIEMHDGVEIIEEVAFEECWSLRGIKLSGVRVIEEYAFAACASLADIEFGDKLESIGNSAFTGTDLRSIKIPKVRTIGNHAFWDCQQLTEVKLSEDLERIEGAAFGNCPLRHIAMPLKDNLLQNNSVFFYCDDLSQVDLVGGIHKTVSSLLLESWRDDMSDEIGSINRDLPNTPHEEKTETIQQWMETVRERIGHYKSEHYTLLKNNMTQLELALWDAEFQNADAAVSRHEARVTCGANIIIPHVLSFLNDEEVFPTVRMFLCR